VHLVTALGYSLRYRNADSLLHGPRLGLGAARRWSSSGAEFGFGLSGTLLLPSTFEDAELTLELRGYSVAIEPWCDLVRLESLRVMAALGVGVDIVRASPSSSSTSVVASPASSNVDPSLAPRLGAYMTLGSVAVGAAFELNLALIRRRYDVREGDQSSPWFKSWYLQPGLLVQALWSGGP
jgi:hypothetical protein